VKLLAGTSGYAFKEWKGSFYPDDLKADGMLGFYSGKFSTVEINNTFYRLPKEHVLLEWAAQVPEPFTFAIKASQRITHHARLKPECAGAVEFLLMAPRAASVMLVGDFNDWTASATPLHTAAAGGLWAVTVPLPPGRYRYAFVVDGTRWQPDPSAPPAPDDEFGSPASVVTIGGTL